MKKLALAAALLATVTGAQAYQVEVQGGSEFIDYTLNDANFSGAFAGTFYFKNVDPAKGPLAEAAFLNQASSVTLGYHFADYSVTTAGTNILDINTHNYGAKGEAYYATPVAPIYASASYTHTKFDSKNNNVIDDDGDRWAVEFGALPINNFLIALGYTSVKNQISYDVLGLVSQGLIPASYETATIGQDEDAITARTKYVGAIDGTNMSIGFEAGLVYGDESQYSFKSDLFVTPKLSIGGFYADSSVNNSNKDGIFGGNVNYFVTDAIAIGASYANANDIVSNADKQTYGLNLKARF